MSSPMSILASNLPVLLLPFSRASRQTTNPVHGHEVIFLDLCLHLGKMDHLREVLLRIPSSKKHLPPAVPAREFLRSYNYPLPPGIRPEFLLPLSAGHKERIHCENSEVGQSRGKVAFLMLSQCLRMQCCWVSRPGRID